MNKFVKCIILIALLVPSFIMSVLVVTMKNYHKLNETNTDIYHASVSDVEFVKESDPNYIKIDTAEYKAELRITYDILKTLTTEDTDKILTAERGDNITFRINKTDSDNLKNYNFVCIRSLSIGEADIFTLDDFNATLTDENLQYEQKIIKFIIVYSVLAVIVWVVLIVLINKNQKKYNVSQTPPKKADFALKGSTANEKIRYLFMRYSLPIIVIVLSLIEKFTYSHFIKLGETTYAICTRAVIFALLIICVVVWFCIIKKKQKK